MPPRQTRRQYEIFWEREAELPERVALAWQEAGQKHDLADIMAGLENVMGELQRWSKRKFGNVLKELDKSRKELEALVLNNADQKEIRRVSDKLNELMYREDMLWLQRS
jgi:hypothetical protein